MQVSDFLRSTADGGYSFFCPGCRAAHHVKTGEGKGPRWGWNGDVVKPTFTPSIKVTYEHWVPPATQDNMYPGPQVKVTNICHSFLTDGKMQFLTDCTHALAGQTVDLPPLPNHMRDDYYDCDD